MRTFVDDKVRLNAELLNIDAQYAKKRTDIDIKYAQDSTALAQATEDQKIAFALTTASSISTIASGLEATGLISAKKAFQINKAASIATATINGYQAVTSALATVPFPFKFATAALVGAAAFAQVASIAATQFQGGGASGTTSARAIGSSTPSAPAPGITVGSVAPSSASQVAASVSASSSPAKTVVVVQNSIDRAGIATLVREGNDEISSRGLAVSSVS
jgi:hypothetical protein